MGECRSVVGAQLVGLPRFVITAAIGWPVADGAVPARPEGILEPVGSMERLVRIEGLDLQQPVVCTMVALEEIETMCEGL